MQQRNGTGLHTSYHAPRLRWLATPQPRVVAQASHWWVLGEYIWSRLHGHPLAGTSTVAWTGLLDRRTGQLDSELLNAAGIGPEQLSPPRDTTQPVPASAPAPARWPALARAAWFPAITDGFASNIGSGASDATVLTAATATQRRVAGVARRPR